MPGCWGLPAGLAVKTVRDVNGTLRLALRRLPRDFGLPNAAADVDLPRRERGLTQYPLRADEMRRFGPRGRAGPRRRPVAARLVRPQPLRRAARPEVGRPGPRQPGAAPPAQPAALGGRRARAAREGRREDGGQPARARAHRRARRGPAGAPPAPGRGAPRRRRGLGRPRPDLLHPVRHAAPPRQPPAPVPAPARAAGLPAHHRLHDLRHTAIQSLLLGGVPFRRSAAPPGTPARR